MRRRLLFLGLLLACTGCGERSVPSGAAYRALLVGVGDYAPRSGWWKLHAARDLSLVREALSRHGFEADRVTELRDREATAAGIVAGFERHLLAPAQPGDVAVFYYSGHGQRLTDDSGDELDGYDEALAPYDAPRQPGPAYRGELHLRDDRLGELLERLRLKVGPTGNVVVFLDSCFSGTGTRSDLPSRGSDPIGEPRPSPGPREPDFATAFRERGSPPQGASLAPMVVFSAARSDELAYETNVVHEQPAGAFSWALARSLSSSTLTLSYRGLFEELSRELASCCRGQEPQAEGGLDTALFNGRAVPQEAFFAVHEVLSGGMQLVLQPGELAGLTSGSEVEVHRAGASRPEAATRLAAGRIVASSPQQAVAELEKAVPAADLEAARVFATAYNFGDLRLRVRLAGKLPPASLAPTLARVAAVELVRDAADLEVLWTDEGPAAEISVTITDTETGAGLVGPWKLARGSAEVAVARRLEDLARSRYLRRLRITDERVATRFEVVPVEVAACGDPQWVTLSGCTVTPLPRARFLGPGGQLELPLGTYFRIRIWPGREPAHLALLDLVPDGRIDVLWPPRGAQEPMMPGDRVPRLLPALYRAAPPGLGILELVASEEFLDFQPLCSVADRAWETRTAPRLHGPLAVLFDDFTIRRRGRIVVSAGALSTHLETFSIRAPS